MEKKKYTKPEATVIIVEPQIILAGSDPLNEKEKMYVDPDTEYDGITAD